MKAILHTKYGPPEELQLRIGDRVFGSTGTKFGAHAEYVCVSEKGALAIKPAQMTFEEAAAITLAGNTALLRRKQPVGL